MVKRIYIVAILTGLLSLMDYAWFILFDSEQSPIILFAELGGLFIYIFIRYGNKHYPDEGV